MFNVNFAIVANNKPAQLPNADAIIRACTTHLNKNNSSNPTANQRGMSLVNESGIPYAWVKFGPSITMAEARTQDYVAHSVNGTAAAATACVRVPNVYLAFVDNDNWGYIIMEFVAGAVCSNTDAPAVAKAVEHLITIHPPNAQLGHFGGSPIFHPLFNDRKSSVEYPSVTLLEDHINGILRSFGYNVYVDFSQEAEAHDLCLCPSDMNRQNFIKEPNDTIVVLDFGEACFLPASFFDLALRGEDSYTRRLRPLISRQPSAQLDGLLLAKGALVVTGNNNLGLPAKLN
ncbi:uncharacterized protein BXZ73DRAFT_96568 [Epithele typhae]|uniref:uncharacterized protein n=1 Tax=Epithele typhae TaxID=378194 RepID=UPI002008E634|nr:uncharacterized protein BXZ73DRAFT_96568 [Epithele typhae]KAH9944062.1 hypothetical protein BXZ73DRAFT_96568 [Epithele typhae]